MRVATKAVSRMCSMCGSGMNEAGRARGMREEEAEERGETEEISTTIDEN